MVYEANKDLRFDKGLSQVRRELNIAGGQFIFDPADFKDMAAGFLVKDYMLSEEGLLEYGRTATKLRQRFQDKADAAMAALSEEGAAEESKEVPVIPVHSRGCKKEVPHKEDSDLK